MYRTVGEKNAVYSGDGDCLIERESKTLIFGCRNSIIPDDGSVTSIGKYAFYSNTFVSSVTIPEGVVSIDDYAFYQCKYIKTIYIPKSIVSISGSAFYDCVALETVYFAGTEEEWTEIVNTFGINDNYYLKRAKIIYQYVPEE